MFALFDSVTCASLPVDALPLLAPLRCDPGVSVALHSGRLWVRFDAGTDRVLRTLLPLSHIDLFVAREGVWHRYGQSLPAFDFPHDAHFQALHQAIFPAPVQPAPAGVAPVTPLRLTLRRDDRSRPTTAMLCPLAALQEWADTVSTPRLDRLHGVTRGTEILVIGANLPALTDGERFWGRLMLVPLGFCPHPDLPEADLREAAGVAVEELLVLRHECAMAVPRTALGRLSRAALRLAGEERR
jgi:hypothetical protein